MTEEAIQRRKIKLSQLSLEIARFDGVLDRIQKVLPDDIEVYDRVCETRDALFRLQNQMRGCKIIEFASSGLDDVIYQNTLNNMFWDKAKQNTHYYDDDDDDDEGVEELQ